MSPLCPADSQEAPGEARPLKGNYDPPDSLELDFPVTKPEESLGKLFTVTSYMEYITPSSSFVKRGQHWVTCSFEFSGGLAFLSFRVWAVWRSGHICFAHSRYSSIKTDIRVGYDDAHL